MPSSRKTEKPILPAVLHKEFIDGLIRKLKSTTSIRTTNHITSVDTENIVDGIIQNIVEMKPETKEKLHRIINEEDGSYEVIADEELKNRLSVLDYLKYELAQVLRSKLTKNNQKQVIDIMNKIKDIDETKIENNLQPVNEIIENIDNLEGGAGVGRGGAFFIGCLLIVTAVTSIVPR
jgi:hypothetical protein